MKELICFSLKRRFLNKTTIVLNLITFLIFGCAFFADKIINIVDKDSFKPLTIYLADNLMNEIDHFELSDQYIIKEYQNEELGKNEVKINYNDSQFLVISYYELDANTQTIINMILSNYLASYQTEIVETYYQVVTPVVEYKSLNSIESLSSDKQTISFMILTSAYFTALSYCASIAGEVVEEKLGHIVDNILVCVKPKKHFLSKVISGLLGIVIQVLLSFSNIFIFFKIRENKDNGVGLMKLLNYLGLFQDDIKSFSDLKRMLDFDKSLFRSILVILIFLILGILLLQIIMAIVSSFANNQEEAGSIQGPFYILLLVVYYLAIYMNEPYAMSSSLGKILSYLPFFSMLFMPCRVLLNVAEWYEIIISILISISTIYLIIDYGSKYYEKGILNLKEPHKIDLNKIKLFLTKER